MPPAEIIAGQERTSESTDTSRETTTRISWQAALLAVYLASVAVALLYFLVRLWPESIGSPAAWSKQVVVFWSATPIRDVSDDMRLLLIVMVAGGLGSFIHAATSFVDYIGNQRFVASWLLWYVMRPLIGSVLAVVLYVAVRGGLMTATASSESISPYGVAAIACLAGMFSKQATDKLSETFTTLFKTTVEGDAARKDKLEATPKITDVSPAQLQAGASAETDLVVNGSGFEAASVARVNGQPKPTTFVSASKLSVKLAPADVERPGALVLTVHNVSGQTSPPVTVTVA